MTVSICVWKESLQSIVIPKYLPAGFQLTTELQFFEDMSKDEALESIVFLKVFIQYLLLYSSQLTHSRLPLSPLLHFHLNKLEH